MKKIFLLLLFIATITQAQIVNIPDANFKAKLINLGVDINSDGNIQFSEASLVTSLNLNYSNISNLIGIESFVSLKDLYCDYNQINTLNISGLVQLERLFCQENQLLNLDVSGLISLKEIYCANNQITSVNLNGVDNLQILNLSNNQLTSLDVSALSNLKELSCLNNQLTLLNVTGLSNLEILSCGQNQLMSLNLNGLSNLIYLSCPINQLASLNLSNLTNLKHLYCGVNLLNSLDVSSLNLLETLSTGYNQLNALDLSGLTNLRSLGCESNQLSVLMLTGVNLMSFNCINNQLSDVDVSSMSNLQYLYCGGNNILNLDCTNNPLLTQLYVNNSLQLQYIYAKNGANETFTITNVPNLLFICSDEEQINTIQNLVASNIVVNSYCSFTPGGDYNTIKGLIQYDFDQNGCDTLDFSANYTRIDVNLNAVSTNSSVFSNGNGEYNLYTSTTGVYNLVPDIENPSFFNVNPVFADVPVMTIDNSVATQNFCITANGVHPDLEIVIAPIVPARPGFTAEYKIVYRNKGNQVMSQLYGVNFFYNQNLMSFVSATQVPSSIVSGGMSWDFANLLPFESRSINVVMQINAPTDTNPVNIGDVLQFTSSIMPMAGDESTVDNLFQFNQTVVGSFDPNDITCIEGDVVDPSYIGEYLHYVINFENSGTASAENIVVRIEVNPNDFDINTLRILESSHNATIKITNNILEIIFQTIMLDTGGHGNVLLKIKSKENLVLNDIVTNNAKIYFDYNFPIETNDANTIFQALNNTIPVKDLSISLYPNPTSSLVTVRADNNIKSVELYDVQGRIIQVDKVDSNEVSIDVSKYNSGVYFVKVTTEFGSQISKIIKE